MLSIIVPCYNGEKHLKTTLTSLVNQSYRSFEVLIIDDGSTDGSHQIAKTFQETDSRFRVIRQNNEGLSAARNTGIDNSRGKVIAFLDSDDWWHKDKCKLHMQHFQRSPEVDISYSDVQFVNEEGEPLNHVRRPRKKNLSSYYLYCRNPITNGSNGFFRANLFENHSFDEGIPRFQDIDCWLRLSFAEGTHAVFEGISGLLTYYRVSTSGLSNSYEEHYMCARRVWEKSFQYAPEIAHRYSSLAKAFQLRFYARRAISIGDRTTSKRFIKLALIANWKIILREPISTLAVIIANVIPSKLLEKALVINRAD